MGREVKRVNKDFNWPVGEGWPGYTISMECPIDRESHEDCALCEGEGTIYPKVEPYAGFGTNSWYQMWETVSEGSPISPPCETPKKLARWLADNGASSCGRDTATYEQWLAMIEGGGWAPSMVMGGDKGIRSGVAAMSEPERISPATQAELEEPERDWDEGGREQ